jgi:formylglycine-generating enzyme required for sulfatase activity
MTRREFAAANLAALAAHAARVPGMIGIPAGPFTMGDSRGDGNAAEVPPRRVEVGAFLLERHDVTKAVWDSVYPWALRHGYEFDNQGLGKASDHPVHSVNWFDSIKWCNARSEMEGRKPCYYRDARRTTVFRKGQIDLPDGAVDQRGEGYRLPTSTEWEKAARGGAEGHRFPWMDGETITHERANYYSSARYEYDVSPTRGYHPAVSRRRPAVYQPGRLFSAERLRFVRYGRQYLAVVLGPHARLACAGDARRRLSPLRI